MKQSTFSAVMANSIKNPLQGYTKGIRFVAVLMLLLTMGIGQAWAAETWTLVKNVNDLAAGDEIVIAASGSNYALGTTQNGNNRNAVTITKNADNVTIGNTVQILTLKAGTISGTFAFYTGSGYLYAASSSKNYLRTETTLTANSSWKITIANTGVATIKAQGSNTHNWLRYNSSNSPVIFSCYSSGQSDVAIYKKKSAAYTLHYGIDGQSNWKSEEFEEVGNNNEMQISNFTIPSTTHFYVGKPDFNGTKGTTDGPNSNTDTWSTMYLANSLDVNYADASPKLGQATGAVGTIRIYSNSTWNNKQAAFIPNGYKLKFGTTEYAFTHQSNGEYHSDIVQYNTTSARYNVSAGVINGSNEYVATNNTQEMQHIFLNSGGTNLWSKDNVTNFGLYDITNAQFTCLMVKVPGEDNLYEGWVPSNCKKVIFVRLSNSTPSWDNKFNQTGDVSLENNKNLFTITQWDNQTSGWSAYTRKGKFRMNDNYKDKNWYVRFYPHYVVNYDANGGDGTMAEQTVPADNASIKISTNTFTRTGYSFNGWKTQTNGGSSYTAGTSYTITSDLTLYAQWKANTYTITLNGNNGSGHTASVTATYNSATLSPSTITNPTRIGYTFKGWYSNASGGSMVIGIDGKLQANVSGYTGANGVWTATSAKTLYAQWTPITYQVKFNGNGSTSGSMSNQTFTYGTAQSLTANAFTRTDHKFAGWNTNADGSGTSYADEASVNNLANTDGTIVNLYAKWKKIHTITWMVNGEQYGETQEVEDGQTIGSLPDKSDAPASCSDKVFMGWTESATVDSDGNNITYINSSTKPDGDKTYHAVFATETTKESTTIIEKTKTETFENQSASTTYNSTQNYTAANSNAGIAWKIYYGTVSTNAVITGSKSAQMRWYDDAASNLPYIQTTSIVKGLKSISFKTLTSDNDYKYSVSYSTNNSTWTNVATSQSVGSTSSTQTKSYTINANGVDAYIKIAITSTNNVTDKATFRIDDVVFTYLESTTTTTTTYSDYVTSCIPTYTITWKNDDGTELDKDYVEHGVVPSYDGEEPTKAATAQYTYTFNGWTPEIVAATEDATYTATYIATTNTYTITWKDWDGTVLETDNKVPYGTTPTYNGKAPNRPEDNTYKHTFAGWDPEVKNVDGDQVYTAKYTQEKHQITITWMVNGEEYTLGDPSATVSAGEKVAKLPTEPTPDAENNIYCGQVFAGWTDKPIEGEPITDAPALLFKTSGSSPTIYKEGDKTTIIFYAVFADYQE